MATPICPVEIGLAVPVPVPKTPPVVEVGPHTPGAPGTGGGWQTVNFVFEDQNQLD